MARCGLELDLEAYFGGAYDQADTDLLRICTASGDDLTAVSLSDMLDEAIGHCLEYDGLGSEVTDATVAQMKSLHVHLSGLVARLGAALEREAKAHEEWKARGCPDE